MFIHDALNELIMCGDTHIEVAELAASIAKMCQTDPNTGMTGFQNQFKVHIMEPLPPPPPPKLCVRKYLCTI